MSPRRATRPEASPAGYSGKPLVDVKVCAFSETLSALKLVVPVARR